VIKCVNSKQVVFFLIADNIKVKMKDDTNKIVKHRSSPLGAGGASVSLICKKRIPAYLER